MQEFINDLRHFRIPNVDSLEQLLLYSHAHSNIDVNKRGYQNYTALHRAVLLSNFNAAKMLLECGADINIKNDFYNAPIHQVPFAKTAEHNTIEFAKLLIKNGADVNMIGCLGTSLLTTAISYETEIEFIKFLIEQCADVYCKCDVRESAFMLATDSFYKQYYPYVTSYRAYIQLLYFTMVFPDLPTYIILWTVDWLDLREMTEYRKVAYIEGFKKSIENIRRKKLIDL